MNIDYIAGFAIGVALIILVFSLYGFYRRLYKRIARRCRKKGCGSTKVKRIHKIILPPDEIVSWRTPQIEEERQKKKRKWRWFIRRCLKMTFSECECGWTELVKIEIGPISVWHAKWAQRQHPEQYKLEEFRLIEVATRRIRRLFHAGPNFIKGRDHELELEGQTSDTPPLSPTFFVDGLFDELEEALDESDDSSE